MRKIAFVISRLLASVASAGPVKVDGGLPARPRRK
jgi:hypothetical protein